jgi:hypothetical protein
MTIRLFRKEKCQILDKQCELVYQKIHRKVKNSKNKFYKLFAKIFIAKYFSNIKRRKTRLRCNGWQKSRQAIVYSRKSSLIVRRSIREAYYLAWIHLLSNKHTLQRCILFVWHIALYIASQISVPNDTVALMSGIAVGLPYPDTKTTNHTVYEYRQNVIKHY